LAVYWKFGSSARGGISETGSDIIPNSDKKRNRGAFVNELYEICPINKKENIYAE
jgi:hypothetical protein